VDFPATRCRSNAAPRSTAVQKTARKPALASISATQKALDQLGHPQVGDRQFELADVELVGAEVAKPCGAQ